MLFLDISVTAPAGFPDHPHRGLILLFRFGFSGFSQEPQLCLYIYENILILFPLFRLEQGLRLSPICYRYRHDHSINRFFKCKHGLYNIILPEKLKGKKTQIKYYYSYIGNWDCFICLYFLNFTLYKTYVGGMQCNWLIH